MACIEGVSDVEYGADVMLCNTEERVDCTALDQKLHERSTRISGRSPPIGLCSRGHAGVSDVGLEGARCFLRRVACI
jgi:hypothetical protein